jgi:6-phosphogluconolactonase
VIYEHFFSDREKMIADLTGYCKTVLEQAVADRGQASILVSGGSTPAPLYKALADSDLPWAKVTIGLVDERWVDITHDKSNEAFINSTLHRDKAGKASLVGLKSTADSAQQGLAAAEQRISDIDRPYNLLVLGMGEDGHTASLFPNAKGLDEALDPDNPALCAAITAHKSAVTGDFTERMTLTPRALLQAQNIILLITGNGKKAVYRKAIESGPVVDMPVRAVLLNATVHVYWAP